jgi:branched-subunit amino acid aminotransferase/4-amino-4-deoxychorismate lyase
MVVLPRAYATGRRMTMTTRTTDTRTPRKQLPLYLPAAGTPLLEGVTRDAVIQLLAQLLTSAVTQDVGGEGRDETR